MHKALALAAMPLIARSCPTSTNRDGTLLTVPTMASAIVPDMFPPDLGWDYSQVLHVEQRLQLYRPLPPAADLRLEKRVVEVFDLGPSAARCFCSR